MFFEVGVGRLYDGFMRTIWSPELMTKARPLYFPLNFEKLLIRSGLLIISFNKLLASVGEVILIRNRKNGLFAVSASSINGKDVSKNSGSTVNVASPMGVGEIATVEPL